MLSFITYFSLLSGLGYYLWPQTAGAFLVVTLLSLGAALRWPLAPREAGVSRLAGLVALGGLVLWGLRLAEWATLEAVRGPWAVVPMVATVALPAVLVGLGVAFKRAEWVILALAGGTFIAAILFPLGFGFDPFVHEATINHLLAYGHLSPKQPYYAAFYGLLQGMVHTLKIPVHQVVTFAIPTLFTLALWWSASRLKTVNPLAFGVSILFFPLMIVTQGTPYALGTIFLMLTMVAVWQQLPKRAIWSLTLATLLTHPIPGVLASAVALSQLQGRLPQLLAYAGAALGVPLMFLSLAWWNGINAFSLHAPLVAEIFPIATNGAYQALPDLLYFVGANRWWWATLVALGGLILTTDRRDAFRWASLWLASNVSAVLVGGGFTFNNLPVYEQLDYALRLKDLSVLLALPLIAVASQSLLNRLPSSKERLALAGLGVIAAASFLIAAYPRHDAYARFGGITASQADLETIRMIENDAPDGDYAVLANQAMSALALREFGFVNRYVGQAVDVYFYPIPTGDPLGLLTTDILQISPTAERLAEAFNITQTSTIYLVIHDYWAQSSTLKARATLLGGKTLPGAAGISVFRFDRPLN